MTLLPDLASRQTTNIQRWEQAILYSAMLLFSAYSIENEDFTKDFIIDPDEGASRININIAVPLNYVTYWASGANFINGVGNFYDGIVTYGGANLANVANPNIVEPSIIVDTLEKYFVYSVINYEEWLEQNQPSSLYRCIFDLDIKKKAMLAQIVLEFDVNAYQSSQDLLASLTFFYNETIGVQSSTVGNNAVISNNFVFKN